MIDTALNFLKKYVDSRFSATIGAPEVIVADVPKDVADIEKDKIYFTLINIEEEKVLKNLPAYQNASNGSVQLMNPELRLNLYLLVSAIFLKDDTSYERQLKYLSMVIAFFQGKHVFEDVDFEALDAGQGLEKIILDLQSTTLDQNNQIWTALQTKLSPSVLYKVRLVVILDKDAEPVSSTFEVKGIGLDLKMKS